MKNDVIVFVHYSGSAFNTGHTTVFRVHEIISYPYKAGMEREVFSCE